MRLKTKMILISLLGMWLATATSPALAQSAGTLRLLNTCDRHVYNNMRVYGRYPYTSSCLFIDLTNGLVRGWGVPWAKNWPSFFEYGLFQAIDASSPWEIRFYLTLALSSSKTVNKGVFFDRLPVGFDFARDIGEQTFIRCDGGYIGLWEEELPIATDEVRVMYGQSAIDWWEQHVFFAEDMQGVVNDYERDPYRFSFLGQCAFGRPAESPPRRPRHYYRFLDFQ